MRRTQTMTSGSLPRKKGNGPRGRVGRQLGDKLIGILFGMGFGLVILILLLTLAFVGLEALSQFL